MWAPNLVASIFLVSEKFAIVIYVINNIVDVTSTVSIGSVYFKLNLSGSFRFLFLINLSFIIFLWVILTLISWSWIMHIYETLVNLIYMNEYHLIQLILNFLVINRNYMILLKFEKHVCNATCFKWNQAN